jgi:hypothetical protein
VQPSAIAGRGRHLDLVKSLVSQCAGRRSIPDGRRQQERSAPGRDSPGGGRVGRFATLLDVVNHDDSVKALGLTGAEAADVVEYLKSL